MTQNRFLRGVLLALALIAGAAPPHARAADDDLRPRSDIPQAAFALAPTFTVSDVGIDTNILGNAYDPRRDTTARVILRADPTSHLGHVDIRGRASLGYAYFYQYSDQRSVDTDDAARVDVHINRVTLFGGTGYLRTRDVFGPEIDVRNERYETSYLGGGELRLVDRLLLALSAQRTQLRFDASDMLLDARLSASLDRDVSVVSAALRQALTPLTTLAFNVETQHDAFEYLTSRNSNSLRVTGGFDFKPSALIDGRAYVGYRRFTPEDMSWTPFDSVVAQLDLGYTLADATRFGVRVDRDLAYSYSVVARYYITTDVRGTVTRRLNRSVDITGMAGRQTLVYPDPMSATVTGGEPHDRILRFGGGAAYRFSPTATLGVNLESYFRESTFPGQSYDRVRLMSSFTYHF